MNLFDQVGEGLMTDSLIAHKNNHWIKYEFLMKGKHFEIEDQ